jgi:hypothetical protein
MRKSILAIIGALYLAVALYDLTPGSSALVSSSLSYNLFLAVMGLMALGAADLGGVEGKWFDFAFGLVLIVLTAVGAVNLINYGTGSVANIFLNGLSAVVLLYGGIVLHHRWRHN